MIPAPSCLGKLPLHGDFLRIRVQQAQKLKLDQWFATRTKSVESADAHVPSNVPNLPWCFVVQGALFGSSRHLMAIGVLFDSADKIGRVYPFMMYQLVPKRWLINQLKDSNNWLKILRDVALQTLTKDSKQLDDMLNKLWAAYKPEWLDFIRAQPKSIVMNKNQKAQQLMSSWLTQINPLPHSELEGVVNPPWLDWPQAVVSENVGSFWWKLDDNGRYLNCIQHPRLDKELLEKLMA